MNNFKNIACCVCNIKFNENQEAVFCPKCGAAYHKNCYKITGKCLYEEMHNSKKVFNYNTLVQDQDEKIKYEICPYCSNKSTQSLDFCSKCGMPSSSGNVNFRTIPFFSDPMGGVDPNEEINNIKTKDIAKFIDTNTQYYIPTFKKISQNKNKFNFSSFLFSGGWFLYRKQYKLGIILTVILFTLKIISSFVEHTYVIQINRELLQLSNINSSLDLTSDKYNIFFQNFYNLELAKKFLFFTPTIINFISLAIMIFSGFLGNKLYFKYCIDQLKNKDKNIVDGVVNGGGVNTKIIPFLFICYIIITNFYLFV